MGSPWPTSSDWRGALATLKGTSKNSDIFRKFEGPQLTPDHFTLFGLDRGRLTHDLEMHRKGEEWCRMLYEMEGGDDDADALRGQGEAALVKEEWEEVRRLFEKAFEASGGRTASVPRPATEGQRLLKQSRAKDYYKVLGVARDADAWTIKKAFRTAAKTATPDKGGTEQKVSAVSNEAYEVLSKPELRQRFDNSDDPNDNSGGHAFQQGGGFLGGGCGGGGGVPVPFQPWRALETIYIICLPSQTRRLLRSATIVVISFRFRS
ncbi:DnaJ domain-containing protein [Mycena haematopus]|nr:DnaJ domain-containing protein [Mycena haematopus]